MLLTTASVLREMRFKTNMYYSGSEIIEKSLIVDNYNVSAYQKMYAIRDFI